MPGATASIKQDHLAGISHAWRTPRGGNHKAWGRHRIPPAFQHHGALGLSEAQTPGLTHHQLAEALGLSRLETDGVLKRHKVSSGVTAEEMRAQAAALRDARPE